MTGTESAHNAQKELDNLYFAEDIDKPLSVKFHKTKLQLEREHRLKSMENELILSKTALFIKGFPRQFTDQELMDQFGKYGEVQSVQIRNEFAIVEFTHRKDAIEAQR